MTGFTKCLRRCFRAPAADWRPLRHTVGKEDAERIRVKITAAAEGRDQIGALHAFTNLPSWHVLERACQDCNLENATGCDNVHVQ